jgi:hypothetical protein
VGNYFFIRINFFSTFNIKWVGGIEGVRSITRGECKKGRKKKKKKKLGQFKFFLQN